MALELDPNVFSIIANEAEKPIRQAVLGLLPEKGQLWSISRIGKHDDLGFPGGKRDPGESLIDTLKRELWEELGIKVKKYQRIFGCVDSDNTWSVIFLVTEWEGVPHDRERRGAVVQLVDPERLVEASCSYRAYNQALFAHLGARLLG